MTTSTVPTAAEITAWQRARWPATWADGDPRVHAAKLAEEAGEVCGAAIKMAEGRRTTADLADEIGDCLVVLSILAHGVGSTLNDLLAARWATVSQR